MPGCKPLRAVITSSALASTLFMVGCAGYTASPDKPHESPPDGDDNFVPLKEAKLIIEHNATDRDTGFQGFFDSEGWDHLDITAPNGETLLSFDAIGTTGELGITELFFETVEPENDDVSIDDMLAKFPEGEYTFAGVTMENGDGGEHTRGTALLTHMIPAGPELIAPAEGAVVAAGPLEMRWQPVTTALKGHSDGRPIRIVAYQLIVERDEEPPPHMIGKRGLSMYLPPTTTRIVLPDGFLAPGVDYLWEVLAIEASGNQTLSSGSFSTLACDPPALSPNGCVRPGDDQGGLPIGF